MEIVKANIQMNKLGRPVMDQFMIDEDYNVSDSKADIGRIISGEGKIKIEETKKLENYIRISGKLQFKMLYATDSSEPVLSSLEGRIPFEEMVYIEDVKVTWIARILSRFGKKTKSGIGVTEVHKLQLMIDINGSLKVLIAAFIGMIGKLIVKRGLFYEIVGVESAGIDGFYEHSAFNEYHTMATLTPKHPHQVCKRIEDKTGIPAMVVDANDIDVVILGKSPVLKNIADKHLADYIKDNPAGQDDECTPFILIRDIGDEEAEDFVPKKAAEKQKATIAALKDGSFCDNAVKSLIAYGGSPNDIRKIELWGQEQILTLDYFIDGLDKWVEAFRNWSELSFSTNGQAGPEKIVRLITEIDKRMNHDFRFSLQWSYDGTYSSKYLRGDTEIKVLENLKKVLTALNDVRLDDVEVEFYIHGVVSFSLIRELNGDLEKIKDYWDGCRKVCAELPKYCWNRSVICYPDYSIAEEVPYRCSKSEGLDYYDFLNKSLACGGDVSGLEFLSGQWNRIMRISFDNMRSCTLDEMVDWLVEIPSQTLEKMDYVTRKMTNGFFCGGGTGELKMLYDGTLVSYQNSIFETELEHSSIFNI